MTYFSGSDGSMYWGSSVSGTRSKLAKVTNWSLSSSQASLDTTTLEDTDRTVIPGMRTTTGSCTLFYYQETRGSNAQNSCSQLIHALIKGRKVTSGANKGIADKPDTVFLDLRLADGQSAGKRISVEAILTNASLTMAVGEVFAAQVSFDVVGAPVSVTI